jgi:tetratricopeptide (TPR) repeat protein
VLQKGIDVQVTLLDSSGKQLLTADAVNEAYGPESVSTIAEDSGSLQLDVSADSGDASAGRYQITLTHLRAPTQTDRTRIKAEQTYTEGVLLYMQGGVESRRAAAAKWQESFALWQSLDDKYGQALSLYSAGAVYLDLGETQKALDYFNQALPLMRAAGDPAGEARTLNEIGRVCDTLGETQKALDYFNQALPRRRAVEDRAGEARTLNNIGLVYSDLGETQKALDYFNQALPLNRAIGNRDAEAATLNNIGTVYYSLGEMQKALDCFNQVLSLERAVGDGMGEETVLGNIGVLYSNLGEMQKALVYYNQALPLARAIGDRAGEATTLGNIGLAYSDLGEKQKALDYYNQSLSLNRAVGNRDGEVAELLVSQGRLPEAQQVLDLLKVEEYSDFTQRRGNSDSKTSPVALTPAEAKSNTEYENITGEITAIGQEYTALRSRKIFREPRRERLSGRSTMCCATCRWPPFTMASNTWWNAIETR